MSRRTILLLIAIAFVLTLHPWTWPSHGARDAIVPGVAFAVVALVVYLCAVKLGDVPSPFRRPPPRPPTRTADDVTRAAEQLLRSSQRRRR